MFLTSSSLHPPLFYTTTSIPPNPDKFFQLLRTKHPHLSFLQLNGTLIAEYCSPALHGNETGRNETEARADEGTTVSFFLPFEFLWPNDETIFFLVSAAVLYRAQ